MKFMFAGTTTLCLMLWVVPAISLIVSRPRKVLGFPRRKSEWSFGKAQNVQSNVEPHAFVEMPSLQQVASIRHGTGKAANALVQRFAPSMPTQPVDFAAHGAQGDWHKKEKGTTGGDRGSFGMRVDEMVLAIFATIIIVAAGAVMAVLMYIGAGQSSHKRISKDSEESSSEATGSGNSEAAGSSASEAVGADSFKAFPRALGPLALRPASWSHPAIQVISQESGRKVWSIAKEAPMWMSSDDLGLFFYSVDEWPIRGRLGPSSPVGKFPGPKNSIPACAQAWGWSHPVDVKSKLLDNEMIRDIAKTGDAEVDFLLHGGFVFYDSAGSICGVRTIGAASPQCPSLHFDAPYHWHEDLMQHIKTSLIKITNDDLRAKGALFHTWVSPDAPVLDCLEAPSLPHGGFLYVFDSAKISGGPRGTPAKNLVFPLREVFPAVGNAGATKLRKSRGT
eukprot:gnl/MRDRNA2_/MRDRNA2_37833_c0_seq1.p1 gnl/MRDRNA2_/MRDRNA2_37833_c0~~gnl/MRDRNA2_/MRDRNA2_37833_c0_seq1.p1  ORF type:complete len:449 (-),score=77.38 gnl/MRDRNA2_/MRDRNA2_37833_c0_seq1:3-1349(-)